MIRYAGPNSLPARPRVAVISNDAIGNYVVVTPLLRLLREQLRPSCIDYYGGTRTQELWSADPKIDSGFALHGGNPRDLARAAAERQPYDLVINVEQSAWARCFAAILCGPETRVCGPCLNADGRADLAFGDDIRSRLWMDKEWVAEDLVARYSILRSGFIAEIFARLAFLEGPMPAYDVPRDDPRRTIPPLLIATSASLPEKLWPLDRWSEALSALRADGLNAGLIGAKPSVQRSQWKGAGDEDELVSRGLVQDLRGVFTMPQVVGALAAARLVLTLDNGILHLAAAAGTPTVGLFRHGIHRLWAPPIPSVIPLTPGPDRAVAAIDVPAVLAACRRLVR